ncbi:Riboflavin synthase alpha chain [Phlyctochytrium planicorne]|nr:Riboflavin synthase alpha chain [Phlyctochytrium planicorne]
MGTVEAVVPVDVTWSGGAGFSITIANASTVLADVKIGDSIAVNGICLTVTEFDDAKASFKVGVAPETMRKTNVEDWKVGDKVNLERAVTADTRMGGHMVQGHVDCPIILAEKRPDPPNSLVLTFSVPVPSDPSITDPLRFIVTKGYVCLNGTSLTVVSVDRPKRQFSVMLIAHTQLMVNLPNYNVGSRINLEVDEIGKYIESIIVSMLERGSSGNEGGLTELIGSIVEEKVEAKLKSMKLV